MHKDREEERLSSAASRPSAESEYESRIMESEVGDHGSVPSERCPPSLERTRRKRLRGRAPR